MIHPNLSEHIFKLMEMKGTLFSKTEFKNEFSIAKAKAKKKNEHDFLFTFT